MRKRSPRHLAFAALRYGGRLHGPPALLEAFLAAAIVISVFSLVLATEPTLWARFSTVFIVIELASISIFVTEYLARVWSCVEHRDYRHPVWGRLKFMATPLMIIDLIAILPSLLPFLGVDLFALRMFRLIRLLKLSRHSEISRMFLQVLKDRLPELITAMLAAFTVMLIASTFMYLVEGDLQPEAFGSIPRAMWWAVVTLTTVGYGDVTPVTPLGRVIVAITAAIGIGVIAVPTALLGSGLTEAMAESRRRKAKGKHRIARQQASRKRSGRQDERNTPDQTR